MTKKRSSPKIAVSLCLFVALFGPVNLLGWAFHGGPPPGYSGAPGDSNCTYCHDSFPVNSGTASFSISTPLIWAPGTAQPVTITFSNIATTRHGFEITARNGSGTVAGTFTAATPYTKSANTANTYHTHNAAGSFQSTWTMSWNAPVSLPNGPITFFAAGNDANGNGDPTGDYIYTTTSKMYKAALSTQTTTWPVGTSQTLSLSAPGHGGQLYFIVPSENPAPFPIPGSPLVLEVTPTDIFFSLVPSLPAVFQNLSGSLNAFGAAAGTINIPFYPQLAGFMLHFAAVSATPALVPTEVSNRLSITFQ